MKTLLPLQGDSPKKLRKPKALSWSRCLLAFQATVLILGLVSCSSMGQITEIEITKPLPPLDKNVEITVYNIDDTIPEHSEMIGWIAIKLKGDWETALEMAKQNARTAGGNGLEIRSQIYPSEKKSYQSLCASILNINDTIEPTKPYVFDKTEFKDYIITNGNDTIPCLIYHYTNRRNSYIGLVYDHNRFGYSKTFQINKKELLSYHIDNPNALEERQKKSSKTFIHQKLFTVQFAVDCGLQYYFDPPISYLMSGKIRFQSNHKFTFGVNYDYSNKPRDPKPGNHFIAGSIGFSGVSFSRPKRTQLDQILGCGCDKEREPMINNRYYLDFLVGYYIGNQLFGNSYLGIGCAIGYDHMISNHFGIGIELSGYPITTKTDYKAYSTHTVVFNLKTGLRYYL